MATPSNNVTLVKDITQNSSHVDGWDWENSHVAQSYTVNGEQQQLSVYDIVESGTVLIAAGPADISAAMASNTDAGIRVVPIGLVETATVAMNKPLSRIFEIGSKLSYIIPGRTVGEIALTRVLFDGPSLLKVIYAGEVMGDVQNGKGQKETAFSSYSPSKTHPIVSRPIGSGNIAINLASSFFDNPVGLCFYFRNNANDDVSQIYFEGCRVSTHNLGIAANMNVLTESIRMEFVQCTPIVSNVQCFTTETISNMLSNGQGLIDIPIIGQNNITAFES